MAQVFYRKWRPQLLSEVVGQEHVTRTLLNALSTGHVSHAYLFCGPRGTGKTSTGRILAKAVNCTKKSTGGKGEPCNKCAMCKSITEARAMDIIEIDAASHTGVDDVRELIERVHYAPAEAAFKVYIIDEVHMLSNAASNALLKTLEEPPARVIFILATTETHKVPLTIVSRCQRFDFRRLNQNDTEAKLNRICQSEGITIAPDALKVIARSSRGGLRDAENLLEQLATFFGTNIELAQVQQLLGLGSGELSRKLLRCIIKKDVTQGLQTISQALAEGLDLKQLGREVVASLRDLLLLKSGIDKEIDLTQDDLREFKTLSESTSLPQILRALKLFSQAEDELGSNSTLPLELALVDISVEPISEKLVAATHIETIPVKTTHLPSHPATVAPNLNAGNFSQTPKITLQKPDPLAPVQVVNPPKADSIKITEVPGVVTKKQISPVIPPAHPVTKAAAENVSTAKGVGVDLVPLTVDKLEQLKNNWRQIIEQAPDSLKRSPAIAILRSAGVKPVGLEGDTVVLTFRYSYHKEKIEELENKKVVAQLISQFTGQACQIKCIYEPAENHLVREAQKLGAQVIEVQDK
jgi:DNA polymerase-3 subunit gamma/tau